MLKLRLWSINGWSCNSLEKDQFAFRRDSSPDNPGAKPNAIVFYCRGPKVKNPNGRICTVPIVQGEPDFEKKIHGWDGNWQEPTIVPSIGCDNRCGWHGHITKGEIKDK